MSWDAAIHGHITIPAAAREAWLASTLDWESVEGHELWNGGSLDATTVAEVLDGYPRANEVEFLEFEGHGERFEVASFQAKDGFLDTLPGIAAAWAAAAPLGGHGELIGMGMMTAAFGYRLVVGDGKASFSLVPEDEVEALDDDPRAAAIAARIEQAIANLD